MSVIVPQNIPSAFLLTLGNTVALYCRCIIYKDTHARNSTRYWFDGVFQMT